MEKKFEQTVYLFKKINPTKKFSSFSYDELDDFKDISSVYFNEEEIVKIKGDYYMFSGVVKNHWNEKRPSVARFKIRGKTVKDIVL